MNRPESDLPAPVIFLVVYGVISLGVTLVCGLWFLIEHLTWVP